MSISFHIPRRPVHAPNSDCFVREIPSVQSSSESSQRRTTDVTSMVWV
jgi:hypothetical protein